MCKQPIHIFPPSIGAIWMRLIMSLVYNAYQTFVLAQCEDFLQSAECGVVSEKFTFIAFAALLQRAYHWMLHHPCVCQILNRTKTS